MILNPRSLLPVAKLVRFADEIRISFSSSMSKFPWVSAAYLIANDRVTGLHLKNLLLSGRIERAGTKGLHNGGPVDTVFWQSWLWEPAVPSS